MTSNRAPDEEWLTVIADPLLAQSAVDRLVSTAHERSPSKDPPTGNARNHQSTAIPLACPLTTRKETRMITHDARWSHSRGRPRSHHPGKQRCFRDTP